MLLVSLAITKGKITFELGYGDNDLSKIDNPDSTLQT